MKWLKPAMAAAILALLGAFLVLMFVKGGWEGAEKDEEGAVEAPSRVSVAGGEKIITLDAAALAKSGIKVEALKPAVYAEEVRAYGTVLGVRELADLRKEYMDAKALVEKARARLDASRKEYERLKALNKENRNVSDKALEAANVGMRTDTADKSVAEESLRALRARALQKWGGVITGWAYRDSPAFRRLTGQKDLLLQITLAQEAGPVPAPHGVTVQTAGGRLVRARLVSPSPSADPRIQGASFFCTIPLRESGLLPGMNVTAYLEGGPVIKGVIVPSSAVVWLQGGAWVYVRAGGDRFVRREVSAYTPVKGGLFVSKGFREGDEVVTKGAELLLSEEFRAQIQTSD